MKYRLFFFIIVSSLCLMPIQAADLVEVAPEDILFLAHFDQSLIPETGDEPGIITQGKLTSGSRGLSLQGDTRQEALDLTVWGTNFAIPGAGHFDARKGTVQMWIKPKWNPKSYGHAVLFYLASEEKYFRDYNYRDIHIQKPPKKMVLQFGQGDSNIGQLIPLEKFGGWRNWMQIGMTWDSQAGQRCLYLNGRLVDRKKYYIRTAKPLAVVFGGPRSWNMNSLLDEVRILKRVLTPEEIARDYQAQSEGKAFVSPSRLKEVDISF